MTAAATTVREPAASRSLFAFPAAIFAFTLAVAVFAALHPPSQTVSGYGVDTAPVHVAAR